MSPDQKITETLSRNVCGGWDRGFLESILEQLSKGRSLSLKQSQTLGKVLARNSAEAEAFHTQWEADYKHLYHSPAIILAQYHSRQPYYRPMAADILAGRVPQRQKFLKMYHNKYSKKVLVAHSTPPRFSPSDHIVPRTGFNAFKDVEIENVSWEAKSTTIGRFKKHGGFVLEVRSEIYSHAKGSKRYKILPIGGTIPLIIEERHLKHSRKCK